MATPVSVSYHDLSCNRRYFDMSLHAKLKKAFGEADSLGILVVTDVPGVHLCRQRLLSQSYIFNSLPATALESFARPELAHQEGYRSGEMESFDSLKSSLLCTLTAEDCTTHSPQRWPDAHMPTLERDFKNAGRIIHGCGLLVAKQLDDYVSTQLPLAKSDTITGAVTTARGRLLHYSPSKAQREPSSARKNSFASKLASLCRRATAYPAPPSSPSPAEVDSWCSWHSDLSTLTGLLPGMYFDSTDCEEAESPDPYSGMYVTARNGTVLHVELPAGRNNVVFQLGEAAQILSGGVLQASPHAVRCIQGQGESSVTRESFALYMQPAGSAVLNAPFGRTASQVQSAETALLLPAKVHPLNERWKSGMTFKEFESATHGEFCERVLTALVEKAIEEGGRSRRDGEEEVRTDEWVIVDDVPAQGIYESLKDLRIPTQ
jgi:hypothetical protein